MIFEISFFLSGLLIVANGRPDRQDLGQQRAADGRLAADDRLDRLAAGRGVGLLQPHVDLRVQLDLARLVRALDFGESANSMPSPLALIRSRVA